MISSYKEIETGGTQIPAFRTPTTHYYPLTKDNKCHVLKTRDTPICTRKSQNMNHKETHKKGRLGQLKIAQQSTVPDLLCTLERREASVLVTEVCRCEEGSELCDRGSGRSGWGLWAVSGVMSAVHLPLPRLLHILRHHLTPWKHHPDSDLLSDLRRCESLTSSTMAWRSGWLLKFGRSGSTETDGCIGAAGVDAHIGLREAVSTQQLLGVRHRNR